MERDRYYRSGGVSRSYSYVTGDPPLNIPSVLSWAISKEKAVCRYMNGGEMQNFDIETENFGVKDTTSIRQERILIR